MSSLGPDPLPPPLMRTRKNKKQEIACFGDLHIFNIRIDLFNTCQNSTDLEIEEKNVIKGDKNMTLIEVGLQDTSRAENLYSA